MQLGVFLWQVHDLSQYLTPSFWFWLFAWVASLCTLGSVLVPPTWFWPVAFLGFAIPFVLVLHGGLLLAFLAMKAWPQAGLSVSILLLGFPFYDAWYQFGGATTALDPSVEQYETKVGASQRLTVLSLNMANLGGKRQRQESRRENAKHMVAWVARQKADILILQEYFEHEHVEEYQPWRAFEAAGLHYKYFAHMNMEDVTRVDGKGVAIYSRYPIGNERIIYRSPIDNNQVVACQIRYLGSDITIYNLHLQSVKLDSEDNPMGRNGKYFWKRAKRLVKKLKTAFILRKKQLDNLTKAIDATKGPILLAGDFNDTPFSYSYWQINRRLSNAFQAKGSGLGITYHGKVPFLRIDNQFYSKDFSPSSFRVQSGFEYSDHFPLIGVYIFEPARPEAGTPSN